MAVKYVKDFSFDRGSGFTGSVQRYAKGGHVTKLPAKAKPAAKGMPAKAKPNAPATGAKKMASPPKVGKGQGYKDGGKVPGREMDRQPTKTPPGRGKDLAPAKPFKGAYEGYAKGGKARRYAEGGDVEDTRAASITPGAGGLDSVRYNADLERMLAAERARGGDPGPSGGMLERSPYKPPDETLPMVEAAPIDTLVGTRRDPNSPFYGRSAEPESYIWSDGTKHWTPELGQYSGSPLGRITQVLPEIPLQPSGPEIPYYEIRGAAEPPMASPGETEFIGIPAPPDAVRLSDEDSEFYQRLLARDDAELARQADSPFFVPPKFAYEDPGFYRRHLEKVDADLARQAEPPMARAVRNVGAGRRVGMGDIMGAARAQQQPRLRSEIPAPYMPTMRDISREESDAYMKSIGKTPSPYAMYAKGGHVKGQAKVGKVMGEYKRGELHSGSKKGPLVKNPKQAVAIALSEARKSGAKIPKKADGGLMASKPAVSKPKSVTVTKVTKTVSDNAKDAALNEKKMLEFLRSLPKDEVAEMMEKRAMQAPAMDPDMPKYRRGGVARKGVPVHKGKAMYGGGKC